MRLVFVHGINQNGKSSDQIKKEWCNALSESELGSKILENYEVTAPFYGNLLVENTDRSKGTEDYEQEEIEFKNLLANDMATYLLEHGTPKTRNIINSNYFENSDEVEKGFPHNQLFVKFARTVQKVSPFRGEIAMRFLEQAHTYYDSEELRSEIDSLIAKTIEEAGDCIVVAHSLGTIVSYRSIRELVKTANITKYITLGSPLGLKSFRNQLGSNLQRPSNTNSWLNAHDPRDFVSMGISLQNYYENVDKEILDVRNTDDDPHAISKNRGYLHDESVLKWIIA